MQTYVPEKAGDATHGQTNNCFNGFDGMDPTFPLGIIPTKLRPGKSVYECRFGIKKLREIDQK